MKAKIERATKAQVESMIADWGPEEYRPFMRVLSATFKIWQGKVDDELICLWGLVPPTLLSNSVYLWLWTSEAFAGNEFIFVRRSQRVIAEVLEEFPIIRGHAAVGQEHSIRWLRWLGAEFGEPKGKLVPFWIVKHG